MAFDELIQFIPELLYEHNCVIIPGFGGFITNYRPSGFEGSRNLISPPNKKVAFNQNLNQNDGLLVNQWAQLKKMEYQDALEYIQGFSNFLKEQITTHKSYDFKNIGIFYPNLENNLIFVPHHGINFLDTSFGLFPVKIKPLQSVYAEPAVLKQKPEPQAEPLKVALESVSEETPEIPIVSKHNNRVTLKVASVILLLAVASIGVYYFVNKMPEDQFTGKPKSEQEASLLYHDSNTKEPVEIKKEKAILQNYQPELKKIEEIKTKLQQFSEVNSSHQETYNVLVGYYPSEAAALQMLNKLNIDFANSKITQDPAEGYAVVVETFYKHTTAEAFSVILKQKGYAGVKIKEANNEN